MASTSPSRPRNARTTLAWGVHLLTASGAVVGALALLCIAAGSFSRAAVLMLLALLIDSVDGTLARRVGVERLVPDIDGRRLDDMVDFLNFVIVPVVFMVQAGSLPGWAWAALPILASAYGFSQENAKTPDDFFLGFPSYWNVVALYLWLLSVSPEAGAAWVTLWSVAVFVPVKYVYASKLRVLRGTTTALGVVWGLLLTVSVLWPEEATRWWLPQISLAYVVYYLGLSFWLGGLRRRGEPEGSG